MNISYQHANPYAGNESFLLRFERDGTQNQTACVLIDAGAGVDVDDLLGDEEYLTAIVLTHAHSDHYLSLAANLRDGAPVYTSEATASILDSVLSEAQKSAANIGDTQAVLDALEPLDGWESPLSDLRIAPVPVGHTPGAAGFIIQFDGDSDATQTIFATGDWTRQRAAGYPGLDTALPVDIDAVFLTASTNDSYEETLTESVGTICERASAGSPVLVSASGLTGVRYAYLLGHLMEQLNRQLSITLAGQAAKLYEDLDYDMPNVKAITKFNDPDKLLASETVTIAGPEVPTEGSSGRLFGAIRNDPNATLVQIVGGGDTPVSSARCTTYDFAVSAHPTEADIDTAVEDLSPVQVVITHRRGRGGNRFKDKYNSFVWATDDKKRYMIYEDGEWVAPPWMTSEGIAYVDQGNGFGRGAWLGDAFGSEDDEIPLPACDRIEGEVDLTAEGLDVRALKRRLRAPSTMKTDPEESEPTKTETETAPMNRVSPSDGSVPTDEALTSITTRLDAIEVQLDGTTLAARVVDAGDGVTLLRLLGEVELEQGRTVEVTIRDTVEDGEG